MKWTLGVSRKTSNVCLWGDCGRSPIGITLLKQIFGYVRQLFDSVRGDSSSLVSHALKEQMDLELKWYKGISAMYLAATGKVLSIMEDISPYSIRSNMKEVFIEIWNDERAVNKKLDFYNSIKENFGVEQYLYEGIKHKDLKCTAQIRMSAHKLRVETGRYLINRDSIINRLCPTCTDLESAKDFAELPGFNPIIEDENHVLVVCPRYHDIRIALGDEIKSNLFTSIAAIFQEELTRETARFVRKVMNRRFPQKGISRTLSQGG